MRKLPIALFIALLAVFPAAAQTPATQTQASLQPVTSVEGITEYRLPNGLKVLLFPDNSKPTIVVNMTYMVGSRHEGYGESGMAHLLEHMMFKGTAKRAELIPEFRNHGANFNGTTSFDRTNYYELMPATDENIRWALEMEADRMVNSRVSRADLDSEMTVVRNEFESGENSPQRVLQERVMSTAYLWHAYGHSPIGSRSDIEHVPIDRLQAFYRNFYQPDNAMLVVAGKFDAPKMLGWIQQTLGTIPKPTRQLFETYTTEPPQDGEREVILRRVGDTQAIMMAFHIPAAAHEDSAALEVLASILGDNASGRLTTSLVDNKKVVSAGAGTLSLHDPSVLMVTASLRKEQSMQEAEAGMLSVINGVITEPPSKDEVDRARAKLTKNIELALNDVTNVALTLSSTASAGDWRLLFTSRDDLAKVTPADVARVAKLYLKPSNRTIGRFIPAATVDRVEIPAAPDLTSKLKDYKGNVVQQGEDFDPSGVNIEARATRVTLPNGLKLIMLPKKNRGGTVIASLNLHFGTVQTVTGRSAAGSLAGALLMRGTQKHNRQQIQDELAKIKAQVNAAGGSTGATASVQTIHDNLVPALQLAAEILRQPSFPESDFETLRQQRLASIEASRSEPTSIAAQALSRHIAPYPAGDPRATPTTEESLADFRQVTLNQVKKFYSDFYGASDGELTVVGDFDPAAVQAAATDLFGNWKSPATYSLIKRQWTALDPVDRTFETPDKANSMVLGVLTLNYDDDNPDYMNMWIANNIFGSGPKSRLFKRIREKDGLSYSVATSQSAGTQEQFGTLIFQAIANPENAAKVQAAFKEELARALSDGFTAQEVEEAKATFMQDNLVQRSQDAFLASTLGRYAQYGRTWKHADEILDRVRAVTPESVNAAFRKLVKPEAFSYFKAGDFAKATTK